MCRADWSTHGEKTGGYFSCNLYDKSAAKKIDDDAGSTLAEAEYFQVYTNNQNNLCCSKTNTL
jgi:ariadne-1